MPTSSDQWTYLQQCFSGWPGRPNRAGNNLLNGGLINSNERLATRYHPCRRPSLSERSRATDGAKESWSELFLPKGVAYVKSLLESVVWFVEKQLEIFTRHFRAEEARLLGARGCLGPRLEPT